MDMKQLKTLIKVLRENGVTSYKTSEIELQLLPEPEKKSTEVYEQTQVNSDNPYASFPDGQLTPSQLMYYSAGGDPDFDPENN
jgi:hypothetical protein